MTGDRPTVWVLVHQLDRGGVPEVLVRYLRWLRSDAGPPSSQRPAVHVVAASGGHHASAIGALAASCTALGPVAGRSGAATVAAASAQLGYPGPGAALHDRWVRWRVRPLPAPDIVVVHGAGGWPLWRALSPTLGGVRLVVHLHELDVAIGRSVPSAERDAMVSDPDLVATVCPPEGELASLLARRASAVAIVPGCVEGPGEDGVSQDAAGEDVAAQREAIVAIGEAGWRKGSDRFEALGHELARRRPGVVCRWIGAPPPSGWQLATGTASPVRWEGPQPDPWAHVGPGAVAVLPSREDPLPLVALEAGARGLPVVGSGAGGLAALLADERGWFVGADLHDLVDATHGALADPQAATARGAALRAHVLEAYVPEAVGPRWLTAVLGT